MRLLSGPRTRPFSSRIPSSWPRIRHQSHSSNPSPKNTTKNTTENTTSRQSHHSHGIPQPQPSQAPGTTVSSAGASPPARTLRDFILNSPLGRLGRTYSRIQQRRPYTTQLCSSVVIYLCGDLSAQLWFPSSPESGYDPWRTAKHLTVGAGASIPSYSWLMYLHHHFNFASKPLSIMTKVCLQQCAFAPIFNTYFFCMHSLLSGGSLSDTVERLKNALPDSLKNSVKVWPIVQTINFIYVPPQFRSLFVGVVAVGWQTYLSWLNQKAASEVESRGITEGSDAHSGIGVTAKA